MRIGEIARRTGASIRALRYYEECGLVVPGRRRNGYRDYDERSVQSVRRVQVLLAAGLPSSAIAEILPCITDDTVVLAGKCQELLDLLARERARLTASIDALHAARDILDSVVGLPLETGLPPQPAPPSTVRLSPKARMIP
jgi:DNA-binding transcriptional MerR regulator